MTALIILIMCILANLKITLQARFSKNENLTLTDNIFYNAVMFLTVAVLFFPSVVKNGVTLSTCVYGIFMGVLSVMFQVFYIRAFSCGKMALTVIINNFGMLLPMFVSLAVFKEEFNFFNIMGTAFALASFVLVTSKQKNESLTRKEKINPKWLFFTLMVFLCNGLISVDQKFYSAFTSEFQVFQFVSVAYITSAVLSFCMLAVLFSQGKGLIVKNKTTVVLSSCFVGIFLGIFQCINTYASSIIDGTLLYSTYNCGVSLLSALTGKIIFKEKLSKKQYTGLFVGIVAILLLCL